MKKAIALIALLVCAVGRPAAAQQPPAAAAPAKLQVLIVTGQHQHDWKGTTPGPAEDPGGHRQVRRACDRGVSWRGS